VLRGLHQIEQPQGKLVRVVVVPSFDVAVDLRKGSKTFGQWVGMHLEHKQQLWYQQHYGFVVLSEYAGFCTRLRTTMRQSMNVASFGTILI